MQALERHFIPISPWDGGVGLLRILCQREVHAAHDKRDAASGQQNTASPHHFHLHRPFQVSTHPALPKINSGTKCRCLRYEMMTMVVLLSRSVACWFLFILAISHFPFSAAASAKRRRVRSLAVSVGQAPQSIMWNSDIRRRPRQNAQGRKEGGMRHGARTPLPRSDQGEERRLAKFLNSMLGRKGMLVGCPTSEELGRD